MMQREVTTRQAILVLALTAALTLLFVTQTGAGITLPLPSLSPLAVLAAIAIPAMFMVLTTHIAMLFNTEQRAVIRARADKDRKNRY